MQRQGVAGKNWTRRAEPSRCNTAGTRPPSVSTWRELIAERDRNAALVEKLAAPHASSLCGHLVSCTASVQKSRLPMHRGATLISPAARQLYENGALVVFFRSRGTPVAKIQTETGRGNVRCGSKASTQRCSGPGDRCLPGLACGDLSVPQALFLDARCARP